MNLHEPPTAELIRRHLARSCSVNASEEFQFMHAPAKEDERIQLGHVTRTVDLYYLPSTVVVLRSTAHL